MPVEAAATILERCEALARLSESSDGILRRYLTPEHQAANSQMASWLAAAGLSSWQDAVGSQWGRLPAARADAPRLILGSHLDTVPNAGAYDGILGVMMGVQVLQYFAQQSALPFHLDVVGFGDEEGTRFGATLIGSRALAGQFDPNWLTLQDTDGVSMAEAFTAFGLTTAVPSAAASADQLLGYWEVHIEQGPVLESLQQPIGIVSSIAGARRARVNIVGHAGHAGTTPMHLRQDALAAATELAQFIEQAACQCHDGEVATIGDLSVSPGAANVIPGQVCMSLDVRADRDERRDALIRAITLFAERLAQRRNVGVTFDWYYGAEAVQCDPSFQALFQQAAPAAPTLPSGAGHDAMAVAALCPVGMLFIRSPKGISHHPDETVLPQDVELAYSALIASVELLAERYIATR